MEDVLFIGAMRGVFEKDGNRNEYFKVFVGRPLENGIGYTPVTLYVTADEFADFKKLSVGDIVSAKIIHLP